ncbi:MAG: hypothetical protein HYT44_01420, partial [Nitrosarchaeum sp.]|nr:hypothetical protein [Nitrosarchaeum sp.]
VPINQTGTYTLLAHSTLFGGNSTTEPVVLAAKFSNISPEIQSIQVQSNKTEIINSIENVTASDFSNKTISNDSQITIQDTNESSFSVGLGVGIGVGIVIGVIMFVIIRQKSNK